MFLGRPLHVKSTLAVVKTSDFHVEFQNNYL